MKHIRVCLSICVLALAAFSLTASPAASTLTVAPPAEGEAIDLNAVRDAARDLHRKLPANQTVEVVFRPGVYTVTNTATLYKVDGHAVWRAEKPGTVRFRGSIAVPTARFRTPTAEEFPYGDAASRRVVRMADVADLLPRELPPWPKEFRTPLGPWLYRNGVPMEIARWPNGTDWMTFTNAVVTAGEAAAVGTKPQADAVRCDDPHAARWDFGKGIWFYGYWCHDWAESFVQGASFDPSTRLLRFSGRHQYGFGGKTWGFAARRFCALNALSELDAPGEWYLDREAKKLYVVAQKGEENASYELATLSVPFVKADGLVDFVFEGLAFTCAHARTAVQLDNSDRVQVRDCAFSNLGGKAIQLTGRDSRVKGCRFDNLGTAGIVLAGGDRKMLRKSDLIVEDCRFRRWARFCRTYNPGVLMQGCGQVVRNCVFRDAPHNAILFRGNDHLIESNEFNRVLMETGDAGAIYTGRDPTELGTMIRGNWFHDLGDPTKRDYTSAVYFDDCDWGDSVVSNRFERLGRGILLGGGNLFRIEGNSFADCKIGIHIDSRGMTWKRWKDDPGWFAKSFDPFRPFNDAWRAAYPDLERTLDDSSAAPWNNVIRGNRFSRCREKMQLDQGVRSVTNRMTIVSDESRLDVKRVRALSDAKVQTNGNGWTVTVAPGRPWSGLSLDFAQCVDATQFESFEVAVSNRSDRPLSLVARFKAKAQPDRFLSDGIVLAPRAADRFHVSTLWRSARDDRPRHLDYCDLFSTEVREPRAFDVFAVTTFGTPPAKPAEDLPLRQLPLDAFGQRADRDWPGKTKSLADLQAAAAEEDLRLARVPLVRQLEGPFRVVRKDGKWRFVDAHGTSFFSLGITCVRPSEGELPDYAWENQRRKYGDDWTLARFAERAQRRLLSWGFNTIGNWSADQAFRGGCVPYVVRIGTKSRSLDGNPKGMKDVFAPEFAENLRASAQTRAAEVKGDRMCLGWFSDNELPWGERDIEIARDVLKSSAEQPAKHALVAWLQTRYPDLAAFNAGWGTDYASWQELQADRSAAAKGPRVIADQKDFTRHFAARYFQSVKEAIEAAAPGTLYLGCRFASAGPNVYRAAADWCDVVSANVYRELPSRILPDGARDRPILIGEFHFGSLDRGHAVAGLRVAANEADRAARFARYVAAAQASDALIGAHWFQWRDQPTRGRADGEAYHIGFVDVADRPYEELTNILKSH